MSKLEQIQALRAARVARNSSRGGVEGHAVVVSSRSERLEGVRSLPAPDTSGAVRTTARAKAGAGIKPGPRETKPKRKAKVKKPKPTKAPKVKIGRPRVEDRGKTLSDLKPWLTAKPPMSRATWYRRQGKP